MSISGLGFFFFKQKTAYEMRTSDWSSDVGSSDLLMQIVRAVRDARAGGPGSLCSDGVLGAADACRLEGQTERSEGRRVGTECVRTCRSRVSPSPSKQNRSM